MRSYIIPCVCVFALVGCSLPSDSPGGNTEKSSNKKSGGNDPNPAVKTRKANPLVGKWITKKGNEHWTANVSKQAVIEFLNDGTTMTITNNNKIAAEADYLWQGNKFVFQARFTRPDGSKNGYGAQVQIEKMTENEVVADVFTLQRIR